MSGDPLLMPGPDASAADWQEYWDARREAWTGDPRSLWALVGLRPPAPACPGVLPAYGTVLVAAASYSGKTYFVLDLALSVSVGAAEFAGHPLHLRGDAVYLAAEDLDGVAHRATAWMVSRGVTVGEVLTVRSLTGADDEFAARGPGWDVLADVCSPESVKVVVIDTLAAALSMIDENDNAEAARLMRRLNGIAESTKTLILLTHHQAKATQKGQHDRGPDARGASALTAGAHGTISLHVDEYRDDEPNIVSWRVTKIKGGAGGTGGRFTFREVGIGLCEDGETPFHASVVDHEVSDGAPPPAPDLDSTARMRATLAREGLLGVWLTPADIQEALGMSSATQRSWCAAAIAAGAMQRDGVRGQYRYLMTLESTLIAPFSL